ncbi:MAG: hypothetical protein JNK23_19475 [Opitutaceae bacterium]|nr:hypothetical protein [Opitutaceae bacterium]
MKPSRIMNAGTVAGWPMRLQGFVASFICIATLGLAAPRDIAISETLPHRGDHTALSWREGAPYVTNAAPLDAKNSAYSSDRRFLRLATGYFAADFDTEAIAITGFARREVPVDEAALVRETLAAAVLPPAQLHLEIRIGNISYRCTGREPLVLNARRQPTTPLAFPVRVIESGRFFQKFALHDLEFRTAAGERLRADARLEVSAWPDRLGLLLVVRPEEALPSAHMVIGFKPADGTELRSESSSSDWTERTEHRAVLNIPTDRVSASPSAADDIVVRIQAADPRGQATAQWNVEEAAASLLLKAPHWPHVPGGNYPESKLDEWESYAVTVENRSAAPQRVGLLFEHTPVKSIIGYVPMVLDADGRPSGLPVQISKNWHVAKSSAPVPYMGQWMHGRTWLNLPANSRVAFHYGTTFARWGGVPTASVAQLSLVGWGHNGFWDQLALGSFGESICFQPGRVMRRSLLTDFRPLFQRGFSKDEKWAWTGNVGGGDTMVRLDPAGRYVPFKRNVARYASHGPNLAHVIYDEISDDEAIRSRTEVFLPRTDDCLRVYLRIRYDVSQRVEFSRLALFQFGADFYNEVDAPQLAWGDAGGLAAELQPKPESGARLLPAWEARGDQPWLSLHGEARADSARVGQASRGLIVREWRATLGGKNVPAPFFVATGTRGAKAHLAADIVPPPELTALAPGDHVEMLLELLPIPLTAERYYGPDSTFAAMLTTEANTWKPVAREAAANRPTLQTANGERVRDWPLTLTAGAEREQSFTLQGGLGWIPVRLTGLTAPDIGMLQRTTSTGREAVVQGETTRAFWQTDYDAAARSWSVTYNLPATERPAHYVFVSRDQSGVSPAAESQTALTR